MACSSIVALSKERKDIWHHLLDRPYLENELSTGTIRDSCHALIVKTSQSISRILHYVYKRRQLAI